MMARYRKESVEVEAVFFDGTNAREIAEFMGVEVAPLRVETPEGTMWAAAGDWVVRSGAGVFYPVKPDVFVATYEPVPEPAP